MTRMFYKTYLIFGSLVLLLVLGIFAAYAITTQAQTGSEPADKGPAINITFPVPELGNCKSKNDCEKYCSDASHMQACIAFAKSHGLMNDKEVAQSQKFAVAIQNGGGPGGCTSPESCRSYCSDINNLQVCLDFAKKQGIANDDIKQGEKIRAYLQAGGKMPGGCTSKESCQNYCGDFSHTQECFNFAKNAGIEQERGGPQGGPGGGGMTAEQFQKLQQLTASGQTPGGCTSKDSCESYCSNSEHQKECLDFAIKVGFMTADQAQKIQASGGKGPGGCDSQSSCQTYCNDPTHQQECIAFGKEHGLISQDEANRIQQGSTRMREGIDEAPEGVKSCIKTSLGTSTIQNIESGSFMPGPGIVDQMKDCFDKFGHSMNPNNAFQNAPPQVQSCIKDKLGNSFNDIISGKTMPTPEMADSLRVCFSQIKMFGPGQGGFNGSSTGGMMAPPPGIENFLQSAPPEIQACLKQQLGTDFQAKIKNGGGMGPDMGEKIKNCMMQFRPQIPGQMMNEERENENEGRFGSSTFPKPPMMPNGRNNFNGQMPPYPGPGQMMGGYGSGTQGNYPMPYNQGGQMMGGYGSGTPQIPSQAGPMMGGFSSSTPGSYPMMPYNNPNGPSGYGSGTPYNQPMMNQSMPYNSGANPQYQNPPPPSGSTAPPPPPPGTTQSPTTTHSSLPSPFAFLIQILQSFLGIR